MPPKLQQNDVIIRFEKVHNDLYDYNEVVYNGMFVKVAIKCKIHNEIFYQTPLNHLQGQTCPLCAEARIRARRTYTTEKFIELVTKIHGDKYDYSESIYTKHYNDIIIICKIHGRFIQKASDHLSGCGCKSCKTSIGESTIQNWLIDNDITYEMQYRFNECRYKNPLPFDFYLPDHNMCIEYDGEQHFKPVRFRGNNKSDLDLLKSFDNIKRNDLIKNNFTMDNNIKLLRISYFDIKIINTILEGVIK